MLILALFACTKAEPVDTAPSTVPWSRTLSPLAGTVPDVRGYAHRRAIIHLHSTWSHDACDGEPQVDGQPNAPCRADLRSGLCDTSIDAAFLTDHPDLAADKTYPDLFVSQDGDTFVDVDGQHRAMQIHCDNGHVVTWLPGIEDDLMPVALDRQVSADSAENQRIYNDTDAEAISAEQAAGATVLMAHTEQRDLTTLELQQDEGLSGVELFNLHAMFAPNIRGPFLGLDPYGWITDVAPFTRPDAVAEPDLFVLAVLQEETPSVERWDALMQRGPMLGTAGTDAHENVLPTLLVDGERGDSYRRMLRWFSNTLLVQGDDVDAYEDAVRAGRSYVAFEVLGTPKDFDVHLDAGGQTYEMGSTAPAGKLTVTCPTLTADSPRGTEAPEIVVTVLRNGQPWQTGCGSWDVADKAVYRVRVDMIPYQLTPFLGDDPTPWLHLYPWIYSNAIRVGF